MVNVEKLLEKMDGFAFQDFGDVKVCGSPKILWLEDELKEANTIPQLMGKLGCSLPLDYYDEIYRRLDNSIFQPNLDKVKENLEKLGLKGRFDDAGDYALDIGSYIDEKYFCYVGNMLPIPGSRNNWRAEELYNNVLKASKEWENEI